MALASDIVEHGLDPSELFIVVEIRKGQFKGRFRVIDGNRRLTALKVLENPNLVDGAVSGSAFRALKELRKSYDPGVNEVVLCILVDSRAEAGHWIELKHTGYQEAGPLRWRPDEGQRFRAASRGELPPAETQALNFLQERGYIAPEFRAEVPTTTFRRLLGTPAVRERIGLDWRDGELIVSAGQEDEVAKVLHHIAIDLSEHNVTVRDLDRKEDRIGYVESLPPELLVERTDGTEGSPADTRPRRRGGQTSTQPRDRLVPPNADLPMPDGRLRDIERELQRLSLKQYPNAVIVLFRVFLELSADSYIEEHGLDGVNEDSSLTHKLNKITDSLVTRKKLTRQQAKAARSAAQRDSYQSPSVTRLHQYLHNLYQYPSPEDLRAEWDNLQIWLQAVWGKEQ